MRGTITGTYAITLHVHDLGKNAKFWETLGLSTLRQDGETATYALPGGGPLVLHSWRSACATNGGRPPGTVSGLMLSVDDAAAACALVQGAGGSVSAPPFPAPDGGKWAVVADPDGNEFVVCSRA